MCKLFQLLCAFLFFPFFLKIGIDHKNPAYKGDMWTLNEIILFKIPI